MVDDVADKNTINRYLFEKDYYQKFISDIKSVEKYIELEGLIEKRDFLIKFSYTEDIIGIHVQYEVGFEICDKNGKTISVPKESPFWDILYDLVSFFPVITYNKLTKKKSISEINKEELAEDCQLFINYLKSL